MVLPQRTAVKIAVRVDSDNSLFLPQLTHYIARIADEWAESTCYYNIHGPTETMILNSFQPHTPGQLLTMGIPHPNTTLYILDKDENPVAFGEKGFMWVGGAGVSRGYVNLPELTATRYRYDAFLDNGYLKLLQKIMFRFSDRI